MAFTLPAFVADSTLTTGNIRLPAFVADSTLSVGGMRMPSFVCDPTLSVGGMRMPAYVVPGVYAWQFPLASGTAAQSPYSSATLPGILASGTALQSPTGSSAGVLQVITGTGTADSGPIPELPLITGTGTAVTGAVTAFNLPQPLPYPVAHGQVAETLDSHATLQGIVASGTALNGSIGTSSATLQIYEAAGFGGAVAVGSSSLLLPYLQARGTGYLGTGATFSAVAVQTEMQGVSTYTNFLFNSLARFNGQTLAAGDAGLFNLTGDKDDGVDIDASVATGISDFGTSVRKRAEDIYVGYRTAGALVFRVTTDEVNVRDYLLSSNNKSGLHGAHVRIGRGVEARYWQFEIRNQAGCDFSLNMLEVKPSKLARRVGGSDA